MKKSKTSTASRRLPALTKDERELIVAWVDDQLFSMGHIRFPNEDGRRYVKTLQRIRRKLVGGGE